MSRDSIDRRAALDRLLKMSILGAGLTAVETNPLLLEDSLQQLKQLKLTKKTQLEFELELKAFKAIVVGGDVGFVESFGPETPRRPITGFSCGEDNDRDGGTCNPLSCDTHGCIGENMGGEGCDTNVCDSQSCDQKNCPKNYCADQKCNGQESCGTHTEALIDKEFIDRHKTDPMIQDLFRSHGLTSSADLARQLNRMLQTRRRELRPVKR